MAAAAGGPVSDPFTPTGAQPAAFGSSGMLSHARDLDNVFRQIMLIVMTVPCALHCPALGYHI